MPGKAIIVGSGPGGSVMAMELAEAGWDVVIFEMGPSYYTNIEGQGPFPTVFSNDELKSQFRYFEQPDPLAYPRTFRQTASQNAATPTSATSTIFLTRSAAHSRTRT